MSWLPPEKHLAVLISTVEQKLSVRKAAEVHGVHRGSVQTWITWHRNGKCTIDMLRAQGVQPSAPIAPVPQGRFWHKEPVESLKKAAKWQSEGVHLLGELVAEREQVSERILNLEERRVQLDKVIDSLLAFPRPVSDTIEVTDE